MIGNKTNTMKARVLHNFNNGFMADRNNIIDSNKHFTIIITGISRKLRKNVTKALLGLVLPGKRKLPNTESDINILENIVIMEENIRHNDTACNIEEGKISDIIDNLTIQIEESLEPTNEEDTKLVKNDNKYILDILLIQMKSNEGI
uniref:Orfan n=1 Tax=Parastrongyloides trichosuri TaxID=131310 RepID=A0A0N5A384_PARTI